MSRKRIIRQTGIFLALVLVLGSLRGVVRLFDVDLKPRLQAAARTLGIGLDYEKLQWSPLLGLSLTKLGINIPLKGGAESEIPLPVSLPILFERLRVSLPLWELVRLRFGSEISAELYQGSAQLSLVGAEDAGVTFSLNQIEIGDHPLGKLLLLRGKLSGNGDARLSNTERSVATLNRADLEFNFLDGSYGGGHMIRSIVKLPPVSAISLHGVVQKRGEMLLLKEMKVESSLGKGDVAGSAKLSSTGSIQRLNLKGELELTDEGRRSFGGYLALAAGGDPTKVASNWNMEFEIRDPASSTFRVSPKSGWKKE